MVARKHLFIAVMLAVGLFGAQSPQAQERIELPSLAPLLKTVTPGVVNLAVEALVPVEESPLFANPLFREFLENPRLRRYFNLPDRPRNREVRSIGSGVIVDAERGYLLTNHHLVVDASDILVTLQDGRRFPARLVGSDDDTDLAVLQIAPERLRAVAWGDSSQLQVGDFVVAIGNPFGLGQTVTLGIVSALGRSGLGIESYEDFIQTDASINPGNSGGALVNLRGELIGINTALFGPSGVSIGIGFAIPSNMARRILDQILTYGAVQRGDIGLVAGDLDAGQAEAIGGGAVILSISPGGPAERSGLEAGDIIVAVNGLTIRNASHLRTVLGLYRVGETLRLKILRGDAERQHRVTIGGLKAPN